MCVNATTTGTCGVDLVTVTPTSACSGTFTPACVSSACGFLRGGIDAMRGKRRRDVQIPTVPGVSPVACATGMTCERGLCGTSCTKVVTGILNAEINPYATSINIDYSMVGGGAGSGGNGGNNDGGGGGSSAIILGANVWAFAAGGSTGSSGDTNGGSLSLPMGTSLTVYVGGGGGGGAGGVNGVGGGGGSGYFGGWRRKQRRGWRRKQRRGGGVLAQAAYAVVSRLAASTMGGSGATGRRPWRRLWKAMLARVVWAGRVMEVVEVVATGVAVVVGVAA